MGSPISVVVAEIVMQQIEKEILTNQNYSPKIWLRYVDDCLTIMPEQTIETFLNYINNINTNI